jgi:hypothetical protein
MIKTPGKIYLQIEDNDGDGLEEITWCTDRINDSDVQYIRADIISNVFNKYD